MNPWPLTWGVLGAGAGVAAWGAFYPGAQLFGPTLRHAGRPNAVALTFDDGPNPEVTPRLLDLFDRHGVRATFFLIGRFVRACPQLAAEIAARGHAVANHTETHPSLLWLSPQHISGELARCQEEIEQATGQRPVWMRPPFGSRGPQLSGAVRRAGLRGVVMWSRLMWDWTPQPAARLIRRLRRVGGGDIVVLHDGWHLALGADREHVVLALEHWLPRWRDAGLEFIALNETAGAAIRVG